MRRSGSPIRRAPCVRVARTRLSRAPGGSPGSRSQPTRSGPFVATTAPIVDAPISGDRPPQAVARTGCVAVAATEFIAYPDGFSFTRDIRLRETGALGSASDRPPGADVYVGTASTQSATPGDTGPHGSPWSIRVARWPNRTFEIIGAGDWSPLRPDPPDSLPWPLSPHRFDRDHHCLPVSRGLSL
jgi:hypothetical protein